MNSLKAFLAACTVGLSACWWVIPSTPVETSATFSKQLRDADGDGFMTSPECDPSVPAPICMDGPWIEDPGCVVTPNPGGCTVIEWTQTITVNPDGTTSYTTCERCVDENGAQIGEEQCAFEEPQPPSMCWMIDDSCWECATPDGDSYVTCVEPSTGCDSDDDCPEGEGCQMYPDPECPPNALCAPVVGGGVCSVIDPNVYCNVNEECPEGQACVPNPDPPCVDEPCFMDQPFYAGICEPVSEGCASDTDCAEGEVCGLPCDNILGYCPIGDATVIGECFPAVDSCASLDHDACMLDFDLCTWVEETNCLTEPCGYCAPIEPVNPCVQHVDIDSCNTDPSNMCGWVADPTIACFTEPCGYCEFVGCGDTATP